MTTRMYKTLLGMAVLLGVFAIIGFAGAHAVQAQVYYYHVQPFGTYHPAYPTPYPYNYPYPYPTYQPLTVTCGVSPSYASAGTQVVWSAYASGGNGYYSYSWSGDEGLTASGQSIAKVYYYPGYKNASVTVYSNGQTVTQNCGSVNVSGYYPYTSSYPYNNYNYGYGNLSVSCSADQTYVNAGAGVTWSSQVYGGNGYYTYSWSGTDGLYGSNANAYYSYVYPGQKTATLTVYSNGQSITQSCSNTVTVGGYGYNYGGSYNYQTTYPTYPVNYTTSNYNGLDIGCYADPTNARVNQPVTWTVEVTGGAGPYKYSWTGSDGLTGTAENAIKYYSTAGSKSAIVTVTSADGKTGTHACSNQVVVSGGARTTVYQPVVRAQAVATPSPTPSVTPYPTASPLNAASVSSFALANVPWGWVAILVILVLFATVLYLIFNREKI